MPPRLNRARLRKPSAASRATALGVLSLGAAAASVIAPASAQAASDVQWDRVAHCESGGNWHANTGNGYFGGLQFSGSTWSSYDVNHYAPRADRATRAQQIDVANHVLASQGWSAWPVCSKNAGTAGTTDHHRAAHIRSAHERAMAQKHGDTSTQSAHAKKAHSASTAKTGTHHVVVHHVVVHRGDTLSSIARAHDINGGWRALYHRNRAVIGPDPADLHVGMRLTY